ncbi:hypothetical protein [Oceanobacter kriegii]|uniref:hypothetical protein n=1 Tax=Oceanobacter kriegii TaxID=64972 RepID=UPI0004223C1A|nr:hypothetical protein [Oceanobacter kriegii]
MELKKSYLAVAIAAATLVGCGSDSSDSNDNDSNNNETGTYSFLSCETESQCVITGTIDEDFTMSSDVQYVLDGLVKVGYGNIAFTSDSDVTTAKNNGVTLTIEPGTDVRGADDGVLIVTRGSKLMAEGTAEAPITFSSLSDEDFDGLGEWGGVILQGLATQYGAGNTGACYGDGSICNVQGEGGDGVGFYGGNEDGDNSGVLKYVRIAEAGKVAGPNNEVNGLTLMGVGHGTTIDYIQVHNNLDDGIEWFGGTVNVTHAVLTGNDDDDIDFDTGYKGNIQYALVVKNADLTAPSGSNDPRGIEANSSDDEYVPQTEGALANITLVGAAVTEGQYGMRLRGSLTTRIYNTAVVNWESCIRVDDSDTDGDDTVDSYSNVTLVNIVGDCAPDGMYTKRDADVATNVVEADIDLDAAAALTSANGELTEAPAMTAVDNGSGFAFDATSYVGAVAPGTAAADAWWAGWVIEGSLDNVANQDDPATTFAAE